MLFRINLNVYPSGSSGYVFKEGDGTIIRGNSWTGVAKKLVEYRRRNGYPAGDPIAEVAVQACARNPSLCKNAGPVPVAAKKPVSLKGRVLGWLASLKKSGEENPLAFVSEPEMKRRAGICAACPLNKSLPEGCNSCKMAVAELRKNLIGNSRLNGIDHRLNACEGVGCDLPAAAWLDEPRIRHDGLPQNCWRKAGV